MPPAAPHPAVPIAIVVGPGCEAACELVARVLATYTDATIYGQIFKGGRLARDEPARVTLPSSPIALVFFATRYQLAPEIEAATGPTDHWDQAHPYDGIDLEAFALRDVERRAHGGWGKCSQMPAFRTAAALPPELRAKFPDAAIWSEPRCASATLVIHADAAFGAVERFVKTCRPSIALRANGYGHELTVTAPSFEVVSQIIASPLIAHVDVQCAMRSVDF